MKSAARQRFLTHFNTSTTAGRAQDAVVIGRRYHQPEAAQGVCLLPAHWSLPELDGFWLTQLPFGCPLPVLCMLQILWNTARHVAAADSSRGAGIDLNVQEPPKAGRRRQLATTAFWPKAQVPKMLGVLRREWAPEALAVSFKLETDEQLLLDKAVVFSF